ncbi:MAG: ATP-binding protein [Kofleriaceae bacterium]
MEQDACHGLHEMRRALAAANNVALEACAARVRAETLCGEVRTQLAQAQKMETLGVLAAGLAHDMNNVLACVVGVAGTLREDLPPASPLRHDVEVIIEQSMRATGLTRKVLAFARKTDQRAEEIEIRRLVDDVLQLLSHTLPRRTRLLTDLEHADARVTGDRSALWQAIVNLCVNGSDAMEEGGTVILTSRRRMVDAAAGQRLGLAPGSYLELGVIDQGPGMDAETLGKAVEPFFTTKSAGKGTGLGLAIVAHTMRIHGGALELESEPGRGTRAALLLPLRAS